MINDMMNGIIATTENINDTINVMTVAANTNTNTKHDKWHDCNHSSDCNF